MGHHRALALPRFAPFRAIAFVADAWRTIPGTHFAVAAGLGLAWGLVDAFGWWLGSGSANLWRMTAHFVYETLLPMLALVLAIAVADAATRAAPDRVAPYLVAAIGAAIAGELLFVITAPLVGLAACHCSMDRWPPGARSANMLPDSLLVCGFVTAGYCHWRRAARRVPSLHAAELERLQVTRRTLESRLQAMQACIEPQFLFDTLAAVERLHATDTKGAVRLLDELIAYLRAALPHLRETTSTVAKESELANAYLHILRLRNGGGLTFSIDVGADAQNAGMPPMVLLPLIDHAVGDLQGATPATDRTLRIAIAIAGARLRLTLTAGGAGPRKPRTGRDAVAGIRDRLHTLYDGRERLTFGTNEMQQVTVTLELPHEPTHGDPR